MLKFCCLKWLVCFHLLSMNLFIFCRIDFYLVLSSRWFFNSFTAISQDALRLSQHFVFSTHSSSKSESVSFFFDVSSILIPYKNSRCQSLNCQLSIFWLVTCFWLIQLRHWIASIETLWKKWQESNHIVLQEKNNNWREIYIYYITSLVYTHYGTITVHYMHKLIRRQTDRTGKPLH